MTWLSPHQIRSIDDLPEQPVTKSGQRVGIFDPATCARKHPFDRKDQAQSVAAAMAKRNGSKSHVYLCACRRYHIASGMQ